MFHIAAVQLAGQCAAQAVSRAYTTQPWSFMHGLIPGPTLQQPPELRTVVESPRCSCSAGKSPLQSPAALPVNRCAPSQSHCTGDFIPHTICRGTPTPGTWPPSRQLPFLPALHSHHLQVQFAVRHDWHHHVGHGLAAWPRHHLECMLAGRGRHQAAPITWPG